MLFGMIILRIFDIKIVQTYPPRLLDEPLYLGKSENVISTVLFIHTSDYLCYLTDCLSPFHPPTARLSVHPSVYPLLFFSTSTDCSSPFRPPAVRLSADCPSVHRLSVAISTVDCPSIQQLSVTVSTAHCPFVHQLSITISTAGCLSIHRLPAYLSVRLPVLYCFSQPPPNTRRRLERQHAQRHRRSGAVDCTLTELAVHLMSHTPPPLMDADYRG